MTEYDLAVIGGGAVGCAAAYHAAGNGKRVLLLEQFTIVHNRGSSHGESRIIRHSYSSVAYASLAPAAFEQWRSLERESEQQLLTMTGGVDIGRATNAALLACREALDEAGFGSIWLEGAEAERAFPQFKLDEGSAVLWQSGAGILNADLCVQSLARRAAARSATIAQESRVSAVEPAGKSVVVRFEMASGESQAVEAGAVVIAAGPWVGRFAPALGVANEFRVTHQQVAYYPVEDGDLWRVGRCPVYIAHGRNGFYGFPTRERPGFIKVSIELDTAIDNPDEAPREPDATAVTRLNSLVERRLRGVVPRPAEVVTCRYTETVRRDYLIDKIPGSPNIVVASPCSGHGFKFSILTGALAAGLATSQAAPSEFPNWRPAFAIGAPEGTPRMLAPDWRDGG